MLQILRWAAVIMLVVALASCSSGRREAAFTLEGVSAPEGVCAVNPQQFGKAEPIPDFREGNGCGINNGFRVFTIGDVGLSPEAMITCDLADALNTWIASSVQPTAQAVYGQKVVSFKVAASYACRPRNNVRGAKLSEHGQGDAIDIAAFTLADGREVNVSPIIMATHKTSAFCARCVAKAVGYFTPCWGPAQIPITATTYTWTANANAVAAGHIAIRLAKHLIPSIVSDRFTKLSDTWRARQGGKFEIYSFAHSMPFGIGCAVL